MKLSKKVATLAAAPLLAASIATAVAPEASAINRVSCSRSDFLWIYSNATTCWANAGTVNVKLYSVQGASSGNNAGYLRSARIVYFSKWHQWNYRSVETVTVVHIN